MKQFFIRYLSCLVLLAIPHLALATYKHTIIPELLSQTENLDKQVLTKALIAFNNARANNITKSSILTIIDYSLPSTEKRLWVFDLAYAELIFQEWVSHGRKSGELYARKFSNRPNSFQSSLGLFKTENAYYGSNGYSLRLEGLEPNINHLAKKRAIVIHGAEYADPRIIRQQGRLGRSQGCPAVRESVNRDLINTIKNGSLVFVYYPDNIWLAGSKFLRNGSRS